MGPSPLPHAASAGKPRIAYLVNQYPKVSHTFIRREIHALERQGFEVLRIALRGWSETAVDPADQREQARTRYVLQGGPGPLLWAALRAAVASPVRWVRAAVLAWRLGWRADRPLPIHLVYFLEACLLLQWLRDGGIGHLHAHFGTNPAEVALLARALGGPPYSFTVHGPEEFDKPQFLGLGEKIRGAAFVAAVSSFGRSQLFRWVGVDHWPKVHVVHCGLEADFLASAPRPVPQAPRLVCVGRLCEQKGQLLLVQAVHRLAQAGVPCELVLAGDGEMRQPIEALIRRCGLQQHVRITGWIDGAAVRDELMAARAMVLPSFAEGLPVALMEAMALQRAVVTTAVAGIPELVRDGEEGWLIPAGSVSALERALRDVLTQPLAELERRGQAARRRVQARHAVDESAVRLGRLFGGVPGGPAAGPVEA